MFKKMMLLALSAAALAAFAAPAQAAVTNSAGEEAQEITAVSEDIVFVIGENTSACATVNLSLNLTAPTTYSGTGTANGHVGEPAPHQTATCTINKIPVLFNTVTVHDVNIAGGGTGSSALTFTFTFITGPNPANWLMCNSQTKAGAPAHLSYTPTGSSITLTGNLEGTENLGSGCPVQMSISGAFDIFDEIGSPVSIH